MFAGRQTSLITILSSEHGRLRREQRDIDKRDLQKALKYGSREKTYKGRWKVEYDGIIFITDHFMQDEITVFPSPLALAPTARTDETSHKNAHDIIKLKPDLCVSHTVLVVDNSGSMRTHDIVLHRDRQTAAYTLTALELIAEQLFNGTANNSDVVSLIEFSGDAKVIFTREPVSWVLYNKLLARRDESSFLTRQKSKLVDAMYSDSNYIPALAEAGRLLSKDIHETCALSLFFLSDGAPTDARNLNISPSSALDKMCKQVKEISSKFGKQLNITMVGFGSALSDFHALETMVKAAKEASPETKAEFVYCDKISNAIGAAVTSVATSLAETRTALMSQGATGRGFTRRSIQLERQSPSPAKWKFYRIANHFVLNPRSNNWDIFRGLPPGSRREGDRGDINTRVQKGLPIPPYLAVCTNAIDTGVERVAFRCRLADEIQPNFFALGPMVAKETDHHERIHEHIEFHKSFCETQNLASFLAHEFNSRLQALPDYNEKTTPRIAFLPCSILLVEDSTWPGGQRGFLVEKELDMEQYEWCKWNNNAGAVDGRVAHVPIDVDHEFAKISRGGFDVIEEGDSEEDEASDDEHDDSYKDDCADNDGAGVGGFGSPPIMKPSDYLQAFSHFSYLYTNCKVLVCDLQGAYNTDMVPPTFELSDPAIHYKSKTREMVYGRTDKGKKGIQLFFNTHRCTKICHLMKLSKKNKQWKENYHEASERRLIE